MKNNYEFEWIDEKEHDYLDPDNKKMFLREYALLEMMKDDIFHVGSQRYIDLDGNVQQETLMLDVNCNDIFAWGCSDGEPVSYTEIRDLWREYRKNSKFGSIKWCCKKRNEKPQEPIIEWMKEQNAWDDELEALPDNQYDKLCAQLAAEKSEEKVKTPEKETVWLTPSEAFERRKKKEEEFLKDFKEWLEKRKEVKPQ